MDRTVCTLTFIRDENRVLLGMKKRGFGEGYWNGFGGKVETKESIHDAACRELQEESGLQVPELMKVAILQFSFENGNEMIEAHVFTGTHSGDSPVESEEMRPRWFDINAVPFDEMWPDDRHWFPLYLAGKKFVGKFHFGEDNTVIAHDLFEVDDIM